MTNPPPSRVADRIIIRLPDGMRDRLHARAEANGRSMTAEVVAMLTAGLNEGAILHLDALVAEHERLRRQSQLIAAALSETQERQESVLREIQAIVTHEGGGAVPLELKKKSYSLFSILTQGIEKVDLFMDGSQDFSEQTAEEEQSKRIEK